MTYAETKLLSSSEKNYLVVLEPATIVEDWTLESGTVYYNDFSISNEFLEYVSQVRADGEKLTSVTSTPGTNQYWWDWDNGRLYVNIGAAPSTKMIVVFFEIHFATKTINTHRDPLDNSTTVTYYAPRVLSASIPSINQSDLLVFGTNQGSINLINSDAAFYVYNDVSFKNKTVKIYHLLDGIGNLKLIFKGKTERPTIDDRNFKLSYRQKDYIFNNQINSYLPTGTDVANGYFNFSDFPNVDPNFNGYCIRVVYGKVDDLAPVNIDYAEAAALTSNRDFVCRSDGGNAHALNYTILASPVSTTTRLYIGPHFVQVDDALKVTISGLPEYTWVTGVGSNYVDVSPAITAPSSGDQVDRSTIGYVKIKDQNGVIYNLAHGRDYTESTFANNTLGFVLADNFESNHSGLTLFDPKSMPIFCRVYGKKHATTNDSQYGNMMAANLVMVDLFTEYIKFTSEDYNDSTFNSLSAPAISLSIPEKNGTVFPTYRDLIKDINRSVLGQIFYDDDSKISYRLLGPMGASIFTLTDKILLSFGVEFIGTDIYNQITVFYNMKERPNGATNTSSSRKNVFSDKATYLHEVENSLDIRTYLIKDSEVDTMADRYMFIYEDWKRIYKMTLKTQLHESLMGDVVEVEREKLIGSNFISGTMRNLKMRISVMKKALTNIEIKADDQKNIEDNSGSW